jgi:hypothetical protein
MDSQDRNLRVRRGQELAAARWRRNVDARLSQPGEGQATRTGAPGSRPWAEFRLAVVGHLVVCAERGQLRAELKSLSAKQWKHPITGKRVTFGFSTIEHWYYKALTNPGALLATLSKKRCNSGQPRSLSKQVCHYLASQAQRHASWSYGQHHRKLVEQMKVHEWGLPPGYSAVRRYLKSLYSSQDSPSEERMVKLERLVLHLKRKLIVESTLNHLLRVPELHPKPFGPPFKYARLGPHEKAYVLSRINYYKSIGGSQSEFCSDVGISTATIERWNASYRRHGETGLQPRKRRKFPNRSRAHESTTQILEIFHSQPRHYDINRASWTGASLANLTASRNFLPGWRESAGAARASR